MTLSKWIWLFIGGGFGTWLRFWISGWSLFNAFRWPVATWTVNLVASLILGYFGMAYQKHPDQIWMYYFIMVGFCGALSTFSTFSAESFTMLNRAEFGMLAVYIIGSVISCLLAFRLGQLLYT